MNLNKMMKAPSNRVFGMILLFGLIVLVVILTKYNQTKSSSKEKMTVKFSPSVYDTHTTDPSVNFNSPHLEVSDMQSQQPPASCNSPANLNPSDLLPKDVNSEWSDVNPASNDLKNVNLLSANQMIGINTVSSSLRNANYQERSDPIIAKAEVGPWYHSTIEPDTLRRPLELG